MAPSRGQRLSVIIPVLNEAAAIQGTLKGLQGLRRNGHEVIVVDGGSEDDTPRLAEPLADHILTGTPRGRARQMNAGAACCAGDVLLFLHADTCLPDGADGVVRDASQGLARFWGRFDVHLSGGHWMLRVVEAMMNLRSRASGIATGDQALFVSRALFEEVGGFPEQPLMEDIALSRALRPMVRPICLRQRVVSSSRRWEEHGIWRTILLMWRLRLAYALGVDAARLAAVYERPRDGTGPWARD